MKKLQASYNNDSYKVVQEVAKEKNTSKNLTFLIDLAIATSSTMLTKDEPQMFHKAWSIPTKNHKGNGMRPFAKNSTT